MYMLYKSQCFRFYLMTILNEVINLGDAPLLARVHTSVKI